MVPLSAVVCLVLLTVATATEVYPCSDRDDNLGETVQLTPCKKLPCKLKKGTNQHISIAFTADGDIPELKNRVTADVFGVSLGFPGVDGLSICDKIFSESGEKVSCPLKAGNKYLYKDSFPVLKIYPTLTTTVHWALQDGNRDLVCFEVPAKIVT